MKQKIERIIFTDNHISGEFSDINQVKDKIVEIINNIN